MKAFIDTNVVLRYLLNDLPEQAERARALIESERQLWLTDVTIAEIAYVLTKNYSVPRSLAVEKLKGLLGRANVSVFGKEKAIVQIALGLCEQSGRVSFADALLWSSARQDSETIVYTFDDRFPRVDIDVRTP